MRKGHSHETPKTFIETATCHFIALDAYCTNYILHADIYERKIHFADFGHIDVEVHERACEQKKHLRIRGEEDGVM